MSDRLLETKNKTRIHVNELRPQVIHGQYIIRIIRISVKEELKKKKKTDPGDGLIYKKHF